MDHLFVMSERELSAAGARGTEVGWVTVGRDDGTIQRFCVSVRSVRGRIRCEVTAIGARSGPDKTAGVAGFWFAPVNQHLPLPVTDKTPTSDIIAMLKREIGVPDHIRGSECAIAGHYRDNYLALIADDFMSTAEAHRQALANAIGFHNRTIVANLIDELAPVGAADVADFAYSILESQGLDAALAEVRRAKAFDGTKGRSN